MLINQLRMLDPFAQLRVSELQTVARHAQVISLPARRWLLRQGRRLGGAYYLLRGRLRVWSPQRELDAQRRPVQQAIYPGVSAIQSRSAVQLLHIDVEPIRFLWESLSVDMAGDMGFAIEQGGELWLRRFLSSPLLQRLEPGRWQALLRAAHSQQYTRDNFVICEGEVGSEFYILRSGRARVTRGDQTLAYLSAGNFFGEDALVTGSPRNASVQMLSDGQLLALGRREFTSLLVDQVLPQTILPSANWGGVSRRVWVGAELPLGYEGSNQLHLPLGELREALPALAPNALYRVAANSRAERALALLLLAQYGLIACAEATPGVGTAS